MKTIAQNTTATEKVITKVQKGFHTSLFPCDENCEQIDLIYFTNGNVECFTLNQNLRNSDRNSIFIDKGEMRVKEDNMFLEAIEL